MRAQAPPTITPPFGYGPIVALQREDRVLLPRGATPEFCRGVNALALSASEFTAASRDYPIAFACGEDGRFAPVVLLGLADKQNLFIGPGGDWDPASYLPAYVRRYPFCMTRVNVSGKEQPERIACVEKRALSAAGDALYDDKGEPLPVWETMRKLLFEFEADLARTEALCKIVIELGLLEPFHMQAKPDGGEPFTLTGMFRVNEQKISALAADQLKELVKNGVLPRIYAHIMSMSNFSKLLSRRATRAKSAEKAEANA